MSQVLCESMYMCIGGLCWWLWVFEPDSNCIHWLIACILFGLWWCWIY